MKNALAPMSLAAGLLVAGNASAGTWAFTYTNLCDGPTCINLSGEFSGVDADHSGSITLNELTGLRAGDYVFHPAWTSNPGDPPAGGMTHSFLYSINSGLGFVATAAAYRVSVYLETGNMFSVVGPVEPAGSFSWTPQTTLRIAEVPEPASAGLLGLGLALVGLRRLLKVPKRHRFRPGREAARAVR